jgi:hypothetical protein
MLPSPPCLFLWKQPRQSTGWSLWGLKGTVVEAPHSEHVTMVSTRRGELSRFDLHLMQRLGSCWNCLSLKKSCSPALKKKSSPQWTHFSVLAENSMLHPLAVLLDCRDLFVYHALKLHNTRMGWINHWRVLNVTDGGT